MKMIWLVIVLGLGCVMALKIVNAQCSGPLTLGQIERLLHNSPPTPDKAIATEINKCGLNFTPGNDTVERLRKLGAGKFTIQAVSALMVITEDLGNGVSLKMIGVRGGSFLMGSSESEYGRDEDEGPQHPVTVSAFFIGKYEVTQAQWRAVMGTNPSRFDDDDNLPIESVSWFEAKWFCRKLSKMTGKPYRLPSEAEWEYACRANTIGTYAGSLRSMAWYGDNSGANLLDSLAIWKKVEGDIEQYNGYMENNKNQPRVVGRKSSNAFALHDMHGNVWEWCEDVWHDNYNDAPSDGSAWVSGGESNYYRVARGGSWSDTPDHCRSAYRNHLEAKEVYDEVGFRVVMAKSN